MRVDDRETVPDETRTVFYKIVVYRRPELTHPIILRVRDYERELLEQWEDLIGWRALCTPDDWRNLVHNLFSRRYLSMMQLAAEGKLIQFMQEMVKDFEQQNRQIVQAAEKEQLGPEAEMLRIQALSAELAAAMIPDQYPDMEPEELEDLTMPQLVKETCSQTMTPEQIAHEYEMDRFTAPLPREITWEYLLTEAREPALEKSAGRNRRLPAEMAGAMDLRKIIIIMMTYQYFQTMNSGDQSVPMPEDILTSQELDQIQSRYDLIWEEFRRRICQKSSLSREEITWAAEITENLFRSPEDQQEPFRNLANLMRLPFMTNPSVR